jgi:hypothetical protein
MPSSELLSMKEMMLLILTLRFKNIKSLSLSLSLPFSLSPSLSFPLCLYFLTPLSLSCSECEREDRAAAGEVPASLPTQDFSLKEGQKITVKIGNKEVTLRRPTPPFFSAYTNRELVERRNHRVPVGVC